MHDSSMLNWKTSADLTLTGLLFLLVHGDRLTAWWVRPHASTQ